MKLKLAVLPGDGIGPEIMEQGLAVTQAICEKFGHELSYEYAICGADAIDKVGDPFPEETFKVCMDADAVLFASVGDPKFDNNPNAKVRPEQGLLAMRKKLGLYANIRPVTTFDCLVHKSPLKDELVRGADFICIRELTGGMYFGEKYQDNDKAYDTNYYTRPEIERILKVGFEYAMKRNRHLTVVDKANVLASSVHSERDRLNVLFCLNLQTNGERVLSYYLCLAFVQEQPHHAVILRRHQRFSKAILDIHHGCVLLSVNW